MKKTSLSLIVAFLAHIVVCAQDFNSVFPIINSTVKDAPVFIGAYIGTSYDFMGQRVLIADNMSIYVGSRQCQYSEGSYITFNYVSRDNANVAEVWGKGASATQLAFYPSGIKTGVYTPYSPIGVPLYAFECTDSHGLRLIDLTDYSVVAELDKDSDPKMYSSLTVFAGKTPLDKDIIVLAGRTKFKIFETIPGTENGVKMVFSSNSKPSFYDINGNKLSQPKKGVNIVVDGETSKKVIVK